MPIRRERSDAAGHRRLILQTAQSLFAKHGVQSVSMHQIAKTAGVGQGTLYRCFSHKGDLCCELVETNFQSQLTGMMDFLQSNSLLTATEKIKSLLGGMIDFIDDHYKFLLPLHNTYSVQEDHNAFFLSPMYRNLMDILSKLIKNQNANAAEQADPVVNAHIILCSLNPSGYIYLREELGYSKEQIKNHYCRLFAGTTI